MGHLTRLFARTVGFFSRTFRKGGGTSVPGFVLLKLDRKAIQRMSKGLQKGRVLISATNGKTTTTRVISKIASSAGLHCLSNPSGANLRTGVATALLNRDPEENLCVFEVDEGALPNLAEELEADTIVLMNLFRDQLDRYGELETIRSKWSEMVDGLSEKTKLIVNADDPSLVFLSMHHQNITYFGLGETKYALESLPHAADSSDCPNCNEVLTYSQITIGHMGHWECLNCGLSRPEPDFQASRVHLESLTNIEFEVSIGGEAQQITSNLPGLHNVYNVLAALCIAETLKIASEVSLASISSVDAAFGRAESISVNGRELILLLAKNPTGANANLDSLLLLPGKLHLAILLNDRIADGRDVSWIWDVDYEKVAHKVDSLFLGGDRAFDLALRFVYGGFDPDLITVKDKMPDLIDSLDSAIPAGETIFALPSYTAMLEFRDELAKRGLTHQFWEEGK